ncbi:leucine-rich repeat transmembrane protein FLRT2-like [Latimeria chalumnae]|uniref:Fibronectin leucine rich transmembrane protein 2 n=1 Tax=Latimeria chalumnae TaxID=7897 RepID=H3BER1_LATCH|nr:PREDICTED: leucine-rich repeat transmembrane protein FLRT2 [Latimeria chalumnae]|eukprot:XP_005990150.1 PREDICTED: leucine-rich repeat transmembrane protein FLRT2 [Latimeria chalumnae]
MGLQTRTWPTVWLSILRLWQMCFFLGLHLNSSQAMVCPSICRCDRTFVYCNERALTSVPLGIPEGTITLFLHNNQINNAGFPRELHKVQSVKTVYLYGNQLDEFPMNLPRNVRVIHLQENNIQTISRAALAQLPKLEELHLDDNSISTVGVEDGAFREAISLKMLFLSKNHLSSVPIGLPFGLQELRVDENRIASISELAFQGLPHLERLVLDGNLLMNKGIEEGAFSNLSNLTEFSIARNSLTLPPVVLPGTYLEKYNLQDNQLDHIPVTAFSHLSQLLRLDLSSNQLKTLSQGVFEGLTNLTHLVVRNNPWFCDCKMKWVSTWLKSLPMSINVRGFMCQGPDKVRGMAMRELNVDLLSCPTTSTTLPYTPHAPTTLSPTLVSPPIPVSVVPPAVGEGFTLAPATPATVPGGEKEGRPTPSQGEGIELLLNPVNDTSILVIWKSVLTIMTFKVTWVKMDHSLVDGIVQEQIITGDTQTTLINLEPKSTYQICLIPLDSFNSQRGMEDTICSEAVTKSSSLNTFNNNEPSSHEQETEQSLGSPFLLAGLIGGAVIVVLVVLLSIFCWHMHKKGRYGAQRWKYNQGRRKDDYCEAGTKKDNSILEVTETSFQILSLNNDQLLKGEFRLQPIYAPNGGLNYTDCHVANSIHYCNSSHT